MRGRILFIDDEAPLCDAAADWLEASGFHVRTETDPARALQAIRPADWDAVVTDMRMPGLTGQQVLDALRLQDADLPVILLSGHADVPVAVAAMQTGAHDFLEKPYRAEHLVEVLDRAVTLRRMRREARSGRVAALSAGRLETRLAGNSAAIRHLRDMVGHLADLPQDVLITGPAGSGRQELARCLHDFGRRARRPFVHLACAGLDAAALDAELLGQDRGPGATARPGRLEQAQGGTLLITDIHRLPPGSQTRLMRALSQGQVERLGAATPRPIELRIVATTDGDLDRAVARGRFRADLFFRLAAARLAMPPLAERPEDIPLLYAAFVQAAAARLSLPAPDLRPADLDRLAAADWPGNLAQLRAAAETAVLALPAAPTAAAQPRTLPERLARIEARLIAEALTEAQGQATRAAEILGIPRRTLSEKIARLGLRAE